MFLNILLHPFKLHRIHIEKWIRGITVHRDILFTLHPYYCLNKLNSVSLYAFPQVCWQIVTLIHCHLQSKLISIWHRVNEVIFIKCLELVTDHKSLDSLTLTCLTVPDDSDTHKIGDIVSKLSHFVEILVVCCSD